MDNTYSCDLFDGSVPFLDLPPEIRNRIYSFYFVETYTYYQLIKPLYKDSQKIPSEPEDDLREGRQQRILRTHPWKSSYDPDLALFNVCHTNTALLMTCKQTYTEALPVYQSTRIFSYVQDHKKSLFHLFPTLLNSLPISFLQSVKHFRINHLAFIYCIDPSLARNDQVIVIRPDLCKEISHVLATNMFPNLTSLVLETEISHHNLCLHYLPTADEIHRQILNGHFEITGFAMMPVTVCTAMRMLSARWPKMQSVIWKFSLFWSVKYIAYGTIHKMERFGWNTYLYDGKLDTLTLDRDESWTAEREAKEEPNS